MPTALLAAAAATAAAAAAAADTIAVVPDVAVLDQSRPGVGRQPVRPLEVAVIAAPTAAAVVRASRRPGASGVAIAAPTAAEVVAAARR